jgi:hypothetical protein
LSLLSVVGDAGSRRPAIALDKRARTSMFETTPLSTRVCNNEMRTALVAFPISSSRPWPYMWSLHIESSPKLHGNSRIRSWVRRLPPWSNKAAWALPELAGPVCPRWLSSARTLSNILIDGPKRLIWIKGAPIQIGVMEACDLGSERDRADRSSHIDQDQRGVRRPGA